MVSVIELAMLVVVLWSFNGESFPTTTERNENSGAAVQAPTPGTVLWCSPCRKRIKDGHPRNPMDLLTLHKKELRGNLNYIRIKLEKLQQLVLNVAYPNDSTKQCSTKYLFSKLNDTYSQCNMLNQHLNTENDSNKFCFYIEGLRFLARILYSIKLIFNPEMENIRDEVTQLERSNISNSFGIYPLLCKLEQNVPPSTCPLSRCDPTPFSTERIGDSDPNCTETTRFHLIHLTRMRAFIDRFLLALLQHRMNDE